MLRVNLSTLSKYSIRVLRRFSTLQIAPNLLALVDDQSILFIYHLGLHWQITFQTADVYHWITQPFCNLMLHTKPNTNAAQKYISHPWKTTSNRTNVLELVHESVETAFRMLNLPFEQMNQLIAPILSLLRSRINDS